jgi:glutathione S-transferase
MKPRILLRQLGLPFERVTVDLFTGETRTEEHLARNADGRVPVLELDSGERIAESGAILLHLGEGTRFLPPPGLARTRVQRWMFFEQNRIEPELAYARFLWLSGRHAQMPEVFENRLDRGRDSLSALERGLAVGGAPFVAGDDYIGVQGYVRDRTCTAPATPVPIRASTRASPPGSTAWRRRRASRTTSSRSPITHRRGRPDR